MIVPMKKLTILCLEADRETALEQLRELGVVHLRHAQAPTGESVDQAKARCTRISRALDMLPPDSHPSDSVRPAAEIVDEITALLEKQKENTTRIDALAIEEKRIAPLGNFDPALIHQLAAKGIFVKLGKAGANDKPVWPDGVAVSVVAETRDGNYVAAISQNDFKNPLPEMRLPEKSLTAIRSEMAELRGQNEQAHKEIMALAHEHKKVAHALLEAEDDLAYAQARAGMGQSRRIAYLQGFIPDESLGKLGEYAKTHGWGTVVDVPTADDNVPTLLRNPKWVQPIKAVFDVTGIIPGYDEVDVSPVFLIALSIFFAMLVGDAGYGTVFLALTIFARSKMKKAPLYPFTFMGIMSVCTIIWGVATANYFGMSFGDKLPGWVDALSIDWLTTSPDKDANIMLLCFTIGAIHISVAHLWNAWLLRNTPQAAAHIGWVLSTWFMFFVAGYFVLERPFPGWIMGAAVIGLVLIILFMTPPKKLKEEWFNHAMLPLTVIGNFTDVVSYLRLFAVGTAGYAVASAFNTMLLENEWGPIWAAALKAIVLFLGHALNIALCGLGILVHGVRLNTLEFSSHMGLQWKGHKYTPFTRKAGGATGRK